jgi:hypothetical protein
LIFWGRIDTPNRSRIIRLRACNRREDTILEK